MLCTPATSVLVVHTAVLLVPAPLKPTVPQPAMVLVPSLKLTLPVSALPVIVAVNVTLAPATAGLAELASVVAVWVNGAQLPVTPPVPSTRKVALAAHPATMVIDCGEAPPSATGAIGFGDLNERSVAVAVYG